MWIDRRVISKEEGADFAKENNLLFFETSAKKGLQVDDVFSLSPSIY